MSNGRKRSSPRQRLDTELVRRQLVASRSQAESYIKLGRVRVNQETQKKAGWRTGTEDKIEVEGKQYVSRAALKLASVADKLGLDFKDKQVLDVGSSTGGFTDYALSHGAKKVIAVDVGTGQIHAKLRTDKRVKLHEKTDIRDFETDETIDLVLIDVSFITLRQVLPSIAKLLSYSSRANSRILAMVKPQFEAGDKFKHRGVIKNDSMRREILKSFESWAKQSFVIMDKADAEITGSKGNRERFYLLSIKREKDPLS
jgi:23S rRNA (cytidine1920-2'-O)/16S rRNA (cytidine1409-2'-O)-methyltransferase